MILLCELEILLTDCDQVISLRDAKCVVRVALCELSEVKGKASLLSLDQRA
jgi:hypothetical protein